MFQRTRLKPLNGDLSPSLAWACIGGKINELAGGAIGGEIIRDVELVAPEAN